MGSNGTAKNWIEQKIFEGRSPEDDGDVRPAPQGPPNTSPRTQKARHRNLQDQSPTVGSTFRDVSADFFDPLNLNGSRWTVDIAAANSTGHQLDVLHVSLPRSCSDRFCTLFCLGVLGACWFSVFFVLHHGGAVDFGAIQASPCKLLVLEAQPLHVRNTNKCGGPPCCLDSVDCEQQCSGRSDGPWDPGSTVPEDDCNRQCKKDLTEYFSSAIILLISGSDEDNADGKGSGLETFNCRTGQSSWDCWPWDCPLRRVDSVERCEVECTMDARCGGFAFSAGDGCYLSAVYGGSKAEAAAVAAVEGSSAEVWGRGEVQSGEHETVCEKTIRPSTAARSSLRAATVATGCHDDRPRSTTEELVCDLYAHRADGPDEAEVASVSLGGQVLCSAEARDTRYWVQWLGLPALVALSVPVAVWGAVVCCGCCQRGGCCPWSAEPGVESLAWAMGEGAGACARAQCRTRDAESRLSTGPRAVCLALPYCWCCAWGLLLGAGVAFVLLPWVVAGPPEACEWTEHELHRAALDRALGLLAAGNTAVVEPLVD